MNRFLLCALSLAFLCACSDTPTLPEDDEPAVPAGFVAAALYPNPDMVIPGTAYTAIAPGVQPPYLGGCPWRVSPDGLVAASDRAWCESEHGITPWVEYTATLAPGRWRVGLNAKNYKFFPDDPGLGPDPSWYPEYEVGTSLSSDIVRIPASDTGFMHGYVYYMVTTAGPLAVRFWFLNDKFEGFGLRDANLTIGSVFFDQVTEMVSVDIKPGSCPNTINAEHNGVISVALLGTSSFDVTTVDPESAWMGNGVSPLRWSLEDVATPYGSVPQGAFDCTERGKDGYLDLNFKFDLQELVASSGETPEDGDVDLVSLTARLKAAYGGTMVEGMDVVRIVVNNAAQ